MNPGSIIVVTPYALSDSYRTPSFVQIDRVTPVGTIYGRYCENDRILLDHNVHLSTSSHRPGAVTARTITLRPMRGRNAMDGYYTSKDIYKYARVEVWNPGQDIVHTTYND